MIKLRQLEDVKRDREFRKNNKSRSKQAEQPIIESQCKFLYHFFHKLLHPFHTAQKDYFGKSDWFLNNENIKQRLYLSYSAETMLEVLQNKLAIIWEQEGVKSGSMTGTGDLVCWNRHHTLPNFPFYAAEVSSLPYFISDDFKTMCEFDSVSKVMLIVRTKPEPGEDRIVGDLPSEALHIETDSPNIDVIKEAYACVAIRGSHEVITYNSKSCLMTTWPLIKVAKKDTEDESKQKHSLSLMTEDGETFIYG